MNSKKNVIIVSARRSGTHLLIDLIVNNFGYESINYNYIDYYKFTDEMPTFESLMNEGGKVTWTHAHDFKDYLKYKHSEEDSNKLDKFFSESKIILVYRDVRDIISSCYHRPRYKSKYKTFDNFYKNFDFDGYELTDQTYDNTFELLLQYYKNWFSVYMSRELLGLDIEIVSFEETIELYTETVGKIGKFLEQPTDDIVDIRLPNSVDKDVIYTTNDFRNGKVGDWVNTLGSKLGTELGEKYYRDLGAGLDCFIGDIKIHKYHYPERSSFQLNSRDWKSLEVKVDKELKEYEDTFAPLPIDLGNRYEEATGRSQDFRYIHKVFHYDDKILKFLYPCKATLEKKVFDTVIPVASKEQLLTIIKTDKFLYDSGITPKLYHAGIYKGVLYAFQERYPVKNVIYEKYNFHPEWGNYDWITDMGYYEVLINHFNRAYENNILLTDIFSVYNCAHDNDGKLKYVDLDGIKKFNSRKEMIDSKEHKNMMGILTEINKYYNKKNGKDNSK